MNPKVVHVKAVNIHVQDLKNRLSILAEECGCDFFEFPATIKDTVVVSCKSEEQIHRIEKLKEELAAEGKTIIISKQGL